MSWQIILKQFGNYKDEPYMVKRSVWKEANLDYNEGSLSIEELEEQLGRKLITADFSNLPLTFKNIRNKPTVLDRIGKERIHEMYIEFAENLFGYGAGSGSSVDDLEHWKTIDVADMKKDLEFLGYDSKPVVEEYTNHMDRLIRRVEMLQ
jgi:hypothetical protein